MRFGGKLVHTISSGEAGIGPGEILREWVVAGLEAKCADPGGPTQPFRGDSAPFTCKGQRWCFLEADDAWHQLRAAKSLFRLSTRPDTATRWLGLGVGEAVRGCEGRGEGVLGLWGTVAPKSRIGHRDAGVVACAMRDAVLGGSW